MAPELNDNTPNDTVETTSSQLDAPTDVEEINEQYVTDIVNGLTSDDVQERISQGKINGDQNVKTKSVLQILRENIVTFFNFVFVAFAVMILFFVDAEDNLIGICGNFGFMVLIIFNALVGIFQEMRAKRTIDKLSLISAPKATVVRDGVQEDIQVKDIVLDDIMVLSSGSQICADSTIVEGTIEVNESLITGEADAILKGVGDEIMSGSFVVSGNAKAQVKHVGIDNFAAKISAGAKYFKKPNSEIWRSLMLIVKVMASIIVPLGIVLFLVKYYIQNNPDAVEGVITSLFGYKLDKRLSETIIGTIATVIGMIPSGLVALSSTVFCVSVLRLSSHNTLAQDLYCVETLARVDVLCLDKTGTITEGTMEVNDIAPCDERTYDDIKSIIKNVTSALEDDNATINALRTFVDGLTAQGNVETTIPFSSQRKWSGARIDGISYVIGAPEFVFDNMDEDMKATTEDMAQRGYRVMILASSAAEFGQNELPSGLKAESFIFITDKIRKEAPATLRFFKKEGVNVKIISGDNPSTVRAVAMRAGLEDCDNIIDMSTLTTEEEVKEAATKYTIFGRVLPDQKLMLVKALKEAGHTVAMTGDGVNDVLALKEADCSVAMASGSDAAKNVSSLVLLDSNFSSMPRVVAEGRRSINNLERSASLYIMKTIYNTLLALLFMFVKDPLPFTPQNLTIMGAVTIGIPSVVLALEPNTDRVTGRFLPKVLHNALPGGICVLFGAIAVTICNRVFLPDLLDEQARTIFIWVITFVGFMLLFKVSFPQFSEVKLNLLSKENEHKKHDFKNDVLIWLNIVTFVAMILLFIAVYFVPLPGDIALNFFNINNNITWEMGKAILSICAVMVPIYLLMTWGMRVLHHKKGAQIDDFFGRVDEKMRVGKLKIKN